MAYFLMAAFAVFVLLMAGLVGTTVLMERQTSHTQAAQERQELVLAAQEAETKMLVADVKELLTDGKSASAQTAKETLELTQLLVIGLKAAYYASGDGDIAIVDTRNELCTILENSLGKATRVIADKECSQKFQPPHITATASGIQNNPGVPTVSKKG